MFADDPVGNWKLSGLRVDYFDIARADAALVATDVWGYGIAVPLASIPSGALFNHTINGPFTDAMLQGAGVNLNVNLYPGGTGAIGEGSYYPDVDIGVNADGSPDCITTGQIFPITDSFNWETDGGQEGNSFPYVNIIGLPSANSKAGDVAYGLGVNGSSVFDNWPSTPTYIPTPSVLPAITPDGVNFLAYGCAGICASGQTGLDFETCMAQCGAAPQYFGAMLPGEWAGYFKTGSLGNSQMCVDADGNPSWSEGCNPDVSFLLEWSAIDGWESESGLGDDLTLDEDGDGTDYDRIFGVPYISSTFVNSTNPLCDITGGALAGASGLTYPVAGDIVGELGGAEGVADLITGQCLQGVADGAYDACIGQVADGVNGLCEEAGSPVDAVTGLCYEASQSDDFAGACDYYGAATALVVTCQQLGFDDETCAAAGEQGVGGVEAYCMYLTGGLDCASAGINQCDVLTDPTFAFGLCGTLASSLTESETCEEWTASFDESWLDAQAADVVGASCTDFAAGLQAGLAAGDPTAIATIDGLFVNVAGMSCSDYGTNYVPMCVEQVAGANTFYVMDPSLTTWGMFVTYNAASVLQYQAAGYDLATIMAYFPYLFVNDSGADFDPTCYADGDGSDCAGRIVFNFAPTCVAEVEAHQIVAEFVNLDDLDCEATGDVAGGWEDLPCYQYLPDDPFYTGCVCDDEDFSGFLEPDELCFDGLWDQEHEAPAGDGVTDVIDVVRIVAHILGTPLGGTGYCAADTNGDGIVNVVDVVAVVNMIFGGSGMGNNDATTTYINYSDTEITVDADGYIGGIDMTIEFDGDFNLEINDKFISDYKIEGNSVHAVIVAFNHELIGDAEALISYEGKILSITAEAANSEGLTTLEVSDGTQPLTFEIKDAYPNPFNPSTTLEMTLDNQVDVSIKVYNLTGQLVDVISEGNYMPGNHTFTWNANNLASGVYFISTQAGNTLNTQKVMLIK